MYLHETQYDRKNETKRFKKSIGSQYDANDLLYL